MDGERTLEVSYAIYSFMFEFLCSFSFPSRSFSKGDGERGTGTRQGTCRVQPIPEPRLLDKKVLPDLFTTLSGSFAHPV